MTRPPLFASVAKLKSAHSKIGELAGLINAFLAGSKVTIRSEMHEGFAYIIGGLNQSPGEDIFLKTGEAGVQLRDALDKMTIALVKANGRGLSGVGFPFGGLNKDTGQPDPFPTERQELNLKKKLTPAQWDLILAQKPHPRGNETLWAVNQIANCDKHWDGLVDVQFSPMLETFNVATGKLGRISIYPEWPEGLVRQHETERVLIKRERDMPDGNGRAGVGIVFGEIPPITGRDVLVTLQAQAREVESIVHLFLKTFF